MLNKKIQEETDLSAFDANVVAVAVAYTVGCVLYCTGGLVTKGVSSLYDKYKSRKKSNKEE